MKKLMYTLFITLSFYSCGNPIGASPPTPEEMAKGLSESERIDKRINSELRIVRDLNEGIALAQKENKPIALIFTGYGVINSRRLEHDVINGNEEVFSLLKNNYINVWLYVDERSTDLSEEDKKAGYKTIGNKWSELQAKTYQGNFQPQIFILNAEGEKLDGGIGYNEAKTGFLPLLSKYKSN